jgi:16S rRNA (adenine1518-N6/adenine1519-N6)-dimethyltransferase
MKAKKSLGQNFLINPKIAERIVIEAGVSSKDVILEIGPGTGNLTKFLLKKAKKVIAIEKDDILAEELCQKFKTDIENNKLEIQKADVLSLDTKDLGQYQIVANIPYNITGAILKKFLTEENKPTSMTLMIQKEVAERIIARDHKESLLSISVKAYGEPKILFKVGRGNFYPAPNVDSAIINIKNISRKNFIDTSRALMDGARHDFAKSEEKFWEIVKLGFAHKRKKLSGNLKSILKDGSIISVPKKDLGNSRAEDLILADWLELTKTLSKD